ncbi:MAG: hypothetical protein V3V99_05110 [candidate division Zixibacteria bacterium]
MPEQTYSAETAEKLVVVSSELCTEMTNYLITRGYFLKLAHIGSILRENFVAILCVLSLKENIISSVDEMKELLENSKTPLRDWLTAVYAATNREYDYENLVTNTIDDLYPYYNQWCRELFTDEEVNGKDIGKWIPAATAACVKNITDELEMDLDVNLSHEVDDLNEIIYRYIEKLS